MSLKTAVHVEVEVGEGCALPLDAIEAFVRDSVSANCPILQDGPLDLSGFNIGPMNGHPESHPPAHIKSVTVSDVGQGQSVSFWQAELLVHVYTFSSAEPEKDFLDGEEEVHAVEQWELPNSILDGLWDSIVVEHNIKESLLGYCDTSMAFSDAGIDPNIISWNRMALLYGPPGTGKTSLCKALAQKAYIRSTGTRYTSGVLLEINAHSLFSKWFSESGKLVMKMFDHITDIAEDTDCFVCILIDEVESLTRSRSAASSGNEPGDAVRVVNAVLTALDALRRQPNVLVLCTSNMIEGIDEAFKDRLDMCIHVGPPSEQARRAILRSCLMELRHKGLVQPADQSETCAFDARGVATPIGELSDIWGETGSLLVTKGNGHGHEEFHPLLEPLEQVCTSSRICVTSITYPSYSRPTYPSYHP